LDPGQPDKSALQGELAETEVVLGIDVESPLFWDLEKKVPPVQPGPMLPTQELRPEEVKRGVDPEHARHVLPPGVAIGTWEQRLDESSSIDHRVPERVVTRLRHGDHTVGGWLVRKQLVRTTNVFGKPTGARGIEEKEQVVSVAGALDFREGVAKDRQHRRFVPGERGRPHERNRASAVGCNRGDLLRVRRDDESVDLGAELRQANGVRDEG
jgi:hypothetical protein